MNRKTYDFLMRRHNFIDHEILNQRGYIINKADKEGEQMYIKRECIDRSEVSRALAKAIAYKNCGKDNKARDWARTLVKLLQCAEILKD